jgi:hypothetical protein
MKAKLFFLTFALALSATLQPSSSVATAQIIVQDPCLAFCSQVRCFPEDVCGQYVNSAGQKVCGCHPRP